jgi:hypothetical protein
MSLEVEPAGASGIALRQSSTLALAVRAGDSLPRITRRHNFEHHIVLAL